MAFALLRNPFFLAGAGGIALLGATIHQYANSVAKKTGFHFKDPDPTLRIVEKDVIIPKYMTKEAKLRCEEFASKFRACVDKTKPNTKERVMTFRSCKKENDDLLNCMDGYFNDFNFYLEVKDTYVREKSIFKASNVPTKDRNMIKNMIRNSESSDNLTGDAEQYYASSKSMYEKTGNIDSYDDYLFESFMQIKSQLVEGATS